MGYKIDVVRLGSAQMSVDNGTAFTKPLEEDHRLELSRSMFFIAFYNSSGEIITPNSGTVKVEVSPIPGQWFESDGTPIIDATTVGELAQYTPPVFDGPFTVGRVTFNNITGADHARAFFWRV